MQDLLDALTGRDAVGSGRPHDGSRRIALGSGVEVVCQGEPGRSRSAARRRTTPSGFAWRGEAESTVEGSWSSRRASSMFSHPGATDAGDTPREEMPNMGADQNRILRCPGTVSIHRSPRNG
jgi:hypothetical protein